MSVLLEESRRWDSASSLCSARSFLRLAVSSVSSFAIEVESLDGEAKVVSVGGFALCRIFNYYCRARIERTPTMNALSSSLDIVEEVCTSVCSTISICSQTVETQYLLMKFEFEVHLQVPIFLPIQIPPPHRQSELP